MSVKESEKVILTNMCMVYDGNKVLVQDRLNKNWKGLTFPVVTLKNTSLLPMLLSEK